MKLVIHKEKCPERTHYIQLMGYRIRSRRGYSETPIPETDCFSYRRSVLYQYLLYHNEEYPVSSASASSGRHGPVPIALDSVRLRLTNNFAGIQGHVGAY